jgi:hypothetical protein
MIFRPTLVYRTQWIEGSHPATKNRRNEDVNIRMNVMYNM